MLKKAALIISMVGAVVLFVGAPFPPKTAAQSEFTLAGEWIVTSSPIGNELISRMGNSLGFPERDMIFEEDGSIRTGLVAREDVGTNVKPLGVWRVHGDRLSATFHLWCPDTSQPCGSIIMRGRFTQDDRIRGTMTAFFDEEDSFQPTGYDTWTFSFRGERIQGGGN
ncbi:MAG: hypothetical protein L0229_27450 [Blastocatellia bacterium]|nr:hypothetical protein [Blastocatellia bacterium]